MERQFNNGDFEKLLRDNANQYRMYPSEKVWKGIHSTLHTRRRWYGFTATLMFLITGSIISIFVFSDNKGKNNLADQKSTAIPGNSQTEASAPVNKKSERFTPSIKPTKPADRRAVYITESSLTGPVFILPAEEDQTSEGLDNSGRVKYEESLQPATPDKNEISDGEQLLINFGILKNNNNIKVGAETFHNEFHIEKSNIEEENSVNTNKENEMSDVISAIASQNVPLAKAKKPARVTAQIFFTPTVSYRKLTENKNVYNNISFYVPVTDLDNFVNHKPAMGLEFGIEGRYQVNKKLFLKTGLQFNINRYGIRAYSHPTEIATVALNSGYGFDSLASLSNYRNFSSGTGANWLENFYFQTAFPIGAELILSDKKNFQWGVSATIQPTYVIGDNSYVLSSDYQNYAKFPDLMRRWNLSSGFGTFVSYSTGRIKWQAGPHVRYQHLSSFVNELTVKEKLFSVGLKVGATLNKN